MSTYNYSYHLLMGTFLQTMFSSPKFEIMGLKEYNNANPRHDLARLEASGKVPAEKIARIKRRQAAEQNCYDGLGIFAAAVIAGNTSGLSARWMNTMSGGYLGLRILYVYLYAVTTSRRGSLWRSLTWWSCNILVISTLWKAGTSLNGAKRLFGQ